MRVKDLERTVNVAWSPATHHPILLAAGTAAQQLDASFSTTAALELFSLSLSEPGADMEKVAGTTTDQRFHQVVWGAGSGESGIIIGGCDGGLIQVYSATKMLAQQEALIARKDGHNGAVRTLDINPFQSNLLASGASDSEIFIWDLDQMGSPMTPGAKAQPPDAVGWLSWNRQVQHILASTFPSRCVVWDLRKNEPIIKLADTTSHVRWKTVNWHPDVATQLCLASEDDMSPVVQLWDLRFATSPLKVLHNHTRGVSCIAWCQHDPDLLLSCARDNRILCWNPNESTPGAELLCEIQTPQQWLFDVAWCPRNPSLISSSSFDGHVSIYCLTGGQQQVVPTTSKIADSFPGMESFAPAMAPQPHVQTTVDLRKPPKWLRRPAGVSFAFGGRLVQFGSDQPGRVVISQMVSEPELLERAAKLDNALSTGQQSAFCLEQASTASTEHLRTLWRFLAAEFSEDPRSELLTLLGYPADKVNVQFSNALTKLNPDLVKQLTNDVGNLSTSEEQKTEGSPDKSSAFEPYQRPEQNGIDGLNNHTLAKEQKPFYIPTSSGDVDCLIGQALLLGHTETAVELCIRQDRMADALLLAMTGGSELLARTQYRYFEKCSGWLSNIISAAVSEDWSSVVSNCNTSSWEQALAGAITHTAGDEFYRLCEHLGGRLEAENNPSLSKSAQVCYLCSGNIDKLVQSWGNEGAPTNSLQLQELVQVAALLKAAERQQGRQGQTSMALAQLMTNYAFLLASQGSFHSALNYLESAHEEAALELKDRLQKSLGLSGPAVRQHVAPRTSLSAQGRRVSGHLLAQPTYPQMADQVYDSPLSYKARSRTTSQSSGYDPQPAAYPSTYNNTFPAVSASPVPYMQPSFTAPPNTPPVTNTGVKPTGLAGRKYVADPSVQSSSPYGGQMYNSSSYGSNQAYGATSQPVSPFMPQQQTQPTPMMPTMYNPSSMVQDNQPEVAQAPAPPRQIKHPFINHQGPPGWNDPPPMSENRQSKPEFVPQTPITHPLFGAGYTEPAMPSNTPGHINGGMYGAPPPQTAQPMMQNSYTQPQGYPTSFSPQPQGYMQPAAPMPPPVATATIAEPPKPKPPIPEAYAQLPNIFDDLRDRCANAAGNPQTRRKLEDVARKLESLYDSLREHKLSATTLGGLQQMAQLIQAGDYNNGLLLHTQMVSGPDFSQISAFMPGLKVLMQTSLQLGVYLQ